MDLQKLKKDLMAKGISVVASTNEITAGLAWSVEGIEKVPRLGELLFYKVNGVEYGVKPSKGNKHDIHWYYDQLKTGMKGAKGYAAGLTQFLNVWVKKGELKIVYKDDKIVESAFDDEICVASPQLVSETGIANLLYDMKIKGVKDNNPVDGRIWRFKNAEIRYKDGEDLAYIFLKNNRGSNKLTAECRTMNDVRNYITKHLNLFKKDNKVTAASQSISETGIDNLLLSEMSLNANKWNHGATGVCWDIVLKGNKVLVIEYLEDEGTANLTYRNGSAKKDIKGIKTIADLRDKIEEYLPKFDANKATAASPRKYRPSIRERMDRDSYLDPLEYPIENRDYAKKFNKFKKEVQDIEVFGFKPFYVWSDIDKEPKDEDFNIHTIIELRNTEIKLEPISSEKERLLDALNTLNEKYKFKILDIDGLSISFNAFIGNNCSGNSYCFELREINGKDLDWFAKNLKTECKLLEKVVEPFSDVTVTASKDESENEDFYQSVKTIANKYQWTLKLTGRSNEYHLLKGDDQINVLYGYRSKFNKHTYHIDVIHDASNHNYWLKSQREFNKTLEGICSKLKKGEYNETRYEVTADSEDDETWSYPEIEIPIFIEDVNKLTINGKKVFKAEQRGEDIVINLLIKKFETDDMDRLNEIVEDKLEILFPITQKWMDADKGQTWGDRKKAGDITMYVEEFSPAEFSDQLVIEDCSKIDWKNLPTELHSIYTTLKNDCDTLSGSNNFKVTADVCEVKETLGELNEENFEGINKEHDRLMYIKVTPEQFLQLWKTSPNFNGQQIQKIVYGFKLALRTLNSKFENKGILIECFYKKKDGKGYIRVEYDKDLYIIYVSRSEDNGEVKVITRKMRKVIPTKNFNILSTSVSSLAFERSNLPSGFKPIWEEVSK